MGFTVTDKHLKRSGLDYWQYLDLTYYEGLDDFFEKHPDAADLASALYSARSALEPFMP